MIPTEKIPIASDFMRSNVHTISADMPLAEIITFLLMHEISNAPVVEAREGCQRLVGFISERDCLAGLTNESFFGSPAPMQTAGTLMRRHPICVAPETDLFALASIFVSHGYRHLPVTSGDELLGIVSRRDILRAVEKYYRKFVSQNSRERFPPDLHQLMNHRFLVSRK
ncbi:MAG: CBS domain-containing protein [Planctomycetales bacterium]|nr:CBS domain-containing protein [Planctomycetales bacterium]